jgi:lysophospholipase L1-like esterase
MKRIIFFIAFILFAGNLLAAETWDILDKSMAAWNADGGSSTSRAWEVNQSGSAGGLATQQTGFVNFRKTGTGQSGYWSWVRPATAITVTSGTVYSIEVKARVRAGNAATEASQISIRLGGERSKSPIYLRYGNGINGSVSVAQDGSNGYTINTSEWQLYRIVLHADHLKYDVYIDGVEGPVFENADRVDTTDPNGVYFGAESQNSCDIDVEYVRMGTGDFYSKPRISSINLSHDHHTAGNASTVTVTAHTTAIGNNEKLSFSLVDGNDGEMVAPVEGTVSNSVATANIVIPSTVAAGQYLVKVAVPGGLSGGTAVESKTVSYLIDPFSQWDILDKSMAAWDEAGGASTGKAWEKLYDPQSGAVVTQQAGYVNITKTNAGATYRYAFLKPPALSLALSTPYSVEIRARVNAINKTEFPDIPGETFEANQIALRLNGKTAPIFLKYGNAESGSVATSATGANLYALNTSEWQLYRFVFHADNSAYDVYVNDSQEPVFEDMGIGGETGDPNGVYFGAESRHRCNIDIEYVKMGTGDFYSKTKIVSIVLSSDSHLENTAKTLTATIHTVRIDDSEKLRISLVNSNDDTVVDAVDATVSQNRAVISLDIPATLPKGEYFVKAAVPGGKIGETDVSPKKSAYTVHTSRFAGKSLITFGNSITIETGSWASRIRQQLGFGDFYNGAVSGARWYRTQENNNNCAVNHIQKYINERPGASPDYAILSYGTNDSVYAAGSVAETMAKASLAEVDLTTIAGASRWCLETLQAKFPKLKIYVALPLQAGNEYRNAGNRQKIAVITAICDALSVTYFDSYNESGITTENQAEYLRDGLHPNDAGKALQAKYIMKKLDEATSSPSSIKREEVRRKSITVSARALSAGQAVSVKSAADGSPLSEIVLRGIAGNAVYRKSLSGDEYTFHAPAVAGIYLLTVRLADSTLETFKILIK